VKESFSALSTSRKAALLASAAAVVSVFLPWVSVLGLSVSGISTGDGKVVLIVAAAAFIVLGNQARLFSFFDVSDRVANVVSAAAAALCLIVAIADMNEFAAIGLYLLLLASVVWAVAAVVNFRARTAAPAEPPTEPADAETSSGS
jgi:hypothetical protein